MYCVKCRRVTETKNITIATSRNGRLSEARSMHRKRET